MITNTTLEEQAAALADQNGRKLAFPSDKPETSGMTKREFMATEVLSGLSGAVYHYTSIDTLANEAVKRTDALLRALAK